MSPSPSVPPATAPLSDAESRDGSPVLVVDDDRSNLESVERIFAKEGFRVRTASDGAQALEAVRREPPAVVVTDLAMPGMDGVSLLRAVKALSPETEVVLMTAYGTVEGAVEAMKEGAYDFIGKPFHRDQLLLAVEKALDRRRLAAEVRDLRIRAAGVGRDVVSVSTAMRRLLEVADRVAATDATVLITGESGTGKEVIARRIHVLSLRAEGPFVAVNCAAIPAELLESELFGHARGAFTGAVRDRAGRFRQASGGTLFLDEVGEIPTALQGKLLRVLQERVVDAVGADAPVPVDVRILAATNRDLPARIRDGFFREDLYYRLNVVELAVPPLRERPSDIPPLVERFVSEFAAGREIAVPADVVAELSRRPWPGNVRELKNACERMVILCRGDEVSLDDLPPAPRTAGAGVTDESPSPYPPLPAEGLSLVDLEKRVIESALRMKGGNITQAALFLRIPRHILVYRIGKYGLRRDA